MPCGSEAADDRRPGPARARMGGDAGRLVDDHQVAVLVDDAQTWHDLRGWARRGGAPPTAPAPGWWRRRGCARQRHLEPHAPTDPVGLAGRPAAEDDGTGIGEV